MRIVLRGRLLGIGRQESATVATIRLTAVFVIVLVLFLQHTWGASPPEKASEALVPSSARPEAKVDDDRGPDPSLYDIPKDAVEKFASSFFDKREMQYFDAGTGELLGQKTFFGKTVIELKLWYRGKLHGIQKEWYRNGQLMSSSPYRMGVMEGVFEYWSESGKRTGYDKIEKGNGVLRHYHENGRLLSEQHFKDSLCDGPDFEFYDSGQVFHLAWKSRGRFVGQAFKFWKGGQLQGWCSLGESGKVVGPVADFDPERKHFELHFVINDNEVEAKEYADLAKKDPKLPKPELNPEYYKQKVTQEIKDLLAKYKALPPVKIPIGPEGPVPQAESEKKEAAQEKSRT
jgi:antitoxin component YwqK of YwqJK toxin-antitoxin module